jgi:hypothetical protein
MTSRPLQSIGTRTIICMAVIAVAVLVLHWLGVLS